MSATTDVLPLTETLSPDNAQDVAAAVRDAHATQTPIYPLGGGASLDFGLAAKQPGAGLSLAGLQQVIDYPARDMTITVEAGVTIESLATTVAAEGQRLPIEAPHSDIATLGGVIATNTSGPRRFGLGTIRDYVIGISAVDGRGTPFKGGGRVVKNVAGYDFCKLLCGSLGTLGVVTQVTLKVVPLVQRSMLLGCRAANLDDAERILAGLIQSGTTPTAVELVAGPAWRDITEPNIGAAVLVGLEGTEPEVAWMVETLQREWSELPTHDVRKFAKDEADALWSRLTEFPAAEPSPLVLKISVPPSSVTRVVSLLREIDANVSIGAHAGSGIVIARFAEFDAGDVSTALIGRIQPAALRVGGQAIVLSSDVGELTRQATWGPRQANVDVMESIKRQFDPAGILNPGRFVY